jgi:hypothetical protein
VPKTLKIWTLSLAVVAAILFAIALSNSAYELTSPSTFAWHVLLRKTYSIGAFALVGYLLRRTLLEHGRQDAFPTCIWAVALFSAAIEVGQDPTGSQEGYVSNLFDIFCGAVGGFISVADLAVARLTSKRARERRPR